tara:strand:+ start:456 stop:920 length:465 start_codon:yes stop_codon:yes gene_type:complete
LFFANIVTVETLGSLEQMAKSVNFLRVIEPVDHVRFRAMSMIRFPNSKITRGNRKNPEGSNCPNFGSRPTYSSGPRARAIVRKARNAKPGSLVEFAANYIRKQQKKPDGRVAKTIGLLLDTQKGLDAAPGSSGIYCSIGLMPQDFVNRNFLRAL